MHKLIRKIKGYAKEINDTERKKLGELSNGKFLVASTVLKIIKDNQPEPPTLRPMSELPKGNVNIVALYDNIITGRFWEDASSHDWGVELNKGGIFRKSENYINCYKQRLLGWIPSIELPNPNEIKLPC